MNKNDLRKQYKTLRAELSNEQREQKSLAIANQLLNVVIWDKTYYHLFLSIEEQKEIDTEFILQVLAGKDKEIVLSKSNFENGEMTHFLLTDNTKIKKNECNIPEPINGLEVPVSKIDVVFVPLLAFDKKGHRVGYGKGFYDRFLSACNRETIKIGLSFFEAEETIEGINESDVLLDYVVTPLKVYHFI
ncbi:5-formyltetrahydrofolate cyclo-ligase [Flavobacterium sp.]|uniref:5-formyltetrahydrofolate cyclo-ligase n=1 Tax=Flavobacterium sp. TaxID=239 RepID=UPI0025BD63CA|nr:5-formyltetrahydrofolate cyclo-ligase [Flavobacterium sp.]MBA4152880.1 5-formyltetrahydrofolate cyclo-ligase [Flavobacterium sp.]